MDLRRWPCVVALVDARLSFVSRIFSGLVVTAALLGLVAFRVTSCAPAPPPKAPPPPPQVVDAGPRRLPKDCRAPGWEHAAAVNASSLEALPWSPFGREETGWRVYAPLVAREIGVDCAPGSTGFARALAHWQKGQGVQPDGLLSQVTFLRMKGEVQGRRPIVLLSAQGICASPAEEASLATARPDEGFGDKVIQLRPAALAAYRRMVAAARIEEPAIAADSELLRIFSAYRSPAYDAARCAAQNNCNGRERANCSPHRTGLAIDIYLGHAPGFGADSSADENRLFMTEGPAYRWMVLNAERFGFVNYPFEPWHWEWTGEAPRTP
jgi:hypothetical protein